MEILKVKGSSIETVCVVCIKEDQSFLYVHRTWEKAQKVAKNYEIQYGTPCVVFEEELKE